MLVQLLSMAEYHHQADPAAVSTNMSALRALLFCGLIAILTTEVTMGQTATRAPVGGVASVPDAMIFCVAHGPPGVFLHLFHRMKFGVLPASGSFIKSPMRTTLGV
jgi:hypothetical protein